MTMVRMESVLDACRLSGRYCIFNVFKKSEIDMLVIGRNLGRPFPYSFIPTYTNVPACVAFPYRGIFHVTAFIRFSKISPSIVVAAVINMVYLAARHLSCHIKERQPVPAMQNSVQPNKPVTVGFAETARHVPGFSWPNSICNPNKLAGEGVVMKYGFKVFLRQFHDALRGVVELGGGQLVTARSRIITGFVLCP